MKNKKDAYYFSHDANAQDDHRCMLLIDELGMEGYGIFWALIEKLRSEKSYQLPIDCVPAFAKRWGTNAEIILKVIKNFKLFKINKNYFYSERLKNSMKIKTDNASRSATIRWGNAKAMQSHSSRNAIGMQNDAIKVKENKETKERKDTVFFPPIGGRALHD